MFAVSKKGGKQYRDAENDISQVEKLAADAGASVTLDEVLMIEDGGKVSVGAPFLSGAPVTDEVVEQARGPEPIVFKKKRRKNYRLNNDHPQDLPYLRPPGISAKPSGPAQHTSRKRIVSGKWWTV